MGFAIKIHGCAENDETAWSEDPLAWWDAKALRRDLRFREVPLTDGTSDHFAVLSRTEAEALASQFAPKALDHQRGSVAELHERLTATPWVVVHIYER